MTLQQFTGDETLLTARQKINAAIVEADKVAGLAASTQVSLDAMTVALNYGDSTVSEQFHLADEALQSIADSRRFEFTQVDGRPGDSPTRFTLVDTLSEASGNGKDFDPIPDVNIAFSEDGYAARVVGAGIIAAREAQPLEKGRLYLLRWVVRRRANASDPSNDSVQNIIIWLDQARNILPGASATTVVRSYDELITASGRQEFQTTISRSSSQGANIVAPPGARYARIADRTFGLDGVTDAEVLQVIDVSNAAILDTISADALSRLDAVEEIDAAARLEALEAVTNTPNSATYPTISDATAATIPASVTTLDTRGRTVAGDTGGGTYQRIAGQLPSGALGFISADGGVWQLVNAFTTILPTRSTLSKMIIPAIVASFFMGGFATAGDRGRNAPYVAAASTDYMAIADKAGRYFTIDCSDVVNPGWFGAIGDGTTSDRAAVLAAVNSPAQIIKFTSGTFIFDTVDVPVGKQVYGSGSQVTSLNGPIATVPYVLRAVGSNCLQDFSTNGRNTAQRGISISGSESTFQRLRLSNCVDALFNENGVFLKFIDVITLFNSHAGIHSADGMNTCFFDRFWSLTGDPIGANFTYTALTDGSPPCQAIHMHMCFFYQNSIAAVRFEKNTFAFVFEKSVIDGQSGAGVVFGPGLYNGGDLYFGKSYIGAGSGASIDIGEGYAGIVVESCVLGNGYNGIICRATTSYRTTSVLILGVQFNNQHGNPLYLDSVLNSLVIGCDFGAFGPAQDIVAPQTFTDPTQPRVKVRWSVFRKANPINPFNVDVLECVGYRTSNRGVQQMLPGTTVTTVAHGCNELPAIIIPTGDYRLGNVGFGNVTATTFDIVSSVAAPSGGANVCWQCFAY
jgi:hypothetical protein